MINDNEKKTRNYSIRLFFAFTFPQAIPCFDSPQYSPFRLRIPTPHKRNRRRTRVPLNKLSEHIRRHEFASKSLHDRK